MRGTSSLALQSSESYARTTHARSVPCALCHKHQNWRSTRARVAGLAQIQPAGHTHCRYGGSPPPAEKSTPKPGKAPLIPPPNQALLLLNLKAKDFYVQVKNLGLGSTTFLLYPIHPARCAIFPLLCSGCSIQIALETSRQFP
jgi:hypothetical protein